MNVQLLIAGILAAMGAAVHAGLPESAIFRNATATTLPRLSLPHPLRFLGYGTVREDTALQWRCLRAGWHFLSVDATATAMILLWVAIAQPQYGRVVGITVAIRFAAYGLLWLAIVAIRDRNLLRAPQWALFFLIAAFAWWGSTPA